MKELTNVPEEIKRDSFVFYTGFYDALEDIHGEEFENCMRAVMEYALNGKTNAVSGSAKIFLTMAKPQIDSNNRKWLNAKKSHPSRTEEMSDIMESMDEAQQLQYDSKESPKEQQTDTKAPANQKQTDTKVSANEKQADTKVSANEKQTDTKVLPTQNRDTTITSPPQQQDNTKVSANVNVNANANANDNDKDNEKDNVKEHVDANAAAKENGSSDVTAIFVKYGIVSPDEECEKYIRAESLKKKDALPASSTSAPKKARGYYKNVYLTDDEFENLTKIYGEARAQNAVEFLSGYIARKPEKSSKCHFEDLRGWVQRALDENEAYKSKAPDHQRHAKSGLSDVSMDDLVWNK